ncbi:NAD-dependent epimerase/dehydratase family protein [Streptacidiphilus neutrinimicus]|uniref:NAD-dependent epimerase/dehydratase family protein n=1 Tax=Streptacidiphilus neutrinimicus TaxID=105420 RepID=UPI0005A6A7C3|nr:NAD-dependent epimerase/dehydratase family protein [Streptacidiphilus neutrinimicus]
MKLLVIGGSVFVGRAFAEEGVRRGWEVTVFNRGRSQNDPDGVRSLRGDRTDEADLAALAAAGPYDAVVDVCGYVPLEVAKSAAALAASADAYLFVSTINVYPGFPAEPTDELSPRQGGRADAGPDDGDYGWLKDGCEKAVRAAFPGRVVVLQPGLIVGPHDRARRTTAWLRRAAQGGRMAVPGTPDRALRLIDVRDLAAFGLDLLSGAPRDEVEDYLVSGAPDNGTWGDFLAACVAATGGKAELAYIDDRIFVDHEVEPWTELPLWLPADRGDCAAVWDASSAKALAAGVRCRPITDSVRETAAWLFGPGGEQEAFEDYRQFSAWTPFLSEEKEQAILAAHDARDGHDAREG